MRVDSPSRQENALAQHATHLQVIHNVQNVHDVQTQQHIRIHDGGELAAHSVIPHQHVERLKHAA